MLIDEKNKLQKIDWQHRERKPLLTWDIKARNYNGVFFCFYNDNDYFFIFLNVLDWKMETSLIGCRLLVLWYVTANVKMHHLVVLYNSNKAML